MPYANHWGEKIYYQVEGKGPELVLQHGGYGSLEDWYEYGYVDGLKSHYRLILIDARGHGKSSKPHDKKKYQPDLFAGDVISVVKTLEVDKFHYYGFSLGGRIGYWIARKWTECLRSLIIAGMHPYPVDAEGLRASAESLREWVPKISNISKKHKSRMLANDIEAMVAGSGATAVDDSDILSLIKVPCMILVGDAEGAYEKARKSAGQIESAAFVRLAGFDHVDTLVRSGIILPHVIQFLSSISSS